jgi:hypothetical protein
MEQNEIVEAELKRVRSLRSQIEKNLSTTCQRLAGDRFDHMMVSRANTVQYLTNARAELRQAALHLLGGHWAPDVSLEPMYLNLIAGDPDHDVRAYAVSCIVELYRGTRNSRVAKRLAVLASDSQNAPVLRVVSYLGLLEIQCIEVPAQLSGTLLISPRSLDAYMDRELLDKLMSDSL